MSETPKNWEAKLVDWIPVARQLKPPEPELTQVQKDLLAAADWLRRNEWCQGAYHRGDASCMVGSLLRVTGEEPVQIGFTAGYLTGRSAAAAERLSMLGFTPHWNDDRGRTRDEVVLALLAAALAK